MQKDYKHKGHNSVLKVKKKKKTSTVERFEFFEVRGTCSCGPVCICDGHKDLMRYLKDGVREEVRKRVAPTTTKHQN